MEYNSMWEQDSLHSFIVGNIPAIIQFPEPTQIRFSRTASREECGGCGSGQCSVRREVRRRALGTPGP